MCMWFGYNPQINFHSLFLHFELAGSHFPGLDTIKKIQSVQVVGISFPQLLEVSFQVHFYADLLETVQVLLSKSRAVHVIWI